MICTLNSAYLPQTDSVQEPKPFTGLLTVWDLESDGWRSFHYDKIIEVEYDEGSSVRREKL